MADIADLAGRYAQVVAHKRTLEAELRDTTAMAEELERELVDAMASAGLSQLAASNWTIYLAVERWARPQPGAEDALMEALDSAGLSDIAKRRINIQSLSAVVRELLDDGGDRPTWLELVDISERPRARVRLKGGAGE